MLMSRSKASDLRSEAWTSLSRCYLYITSKIRLQQSSRYTHNLNDIYSPLVITENPILSSHHNSISDRIENVFPLEEVILKTPSQLYLALGQIGTGKTWLGRHIASTWSSDLVNEGKSILIYIDCEIPEVKYGVDILNIMSSLPMKENSAFMTFFEQEMRKDGRDFIFIIDGYDVILRSSPNNPLKQIIERNLFAKSTVLVLSRPCLHFYESNEIYSEYKQLEVLGFSSRSCIEYFTKTSMKFFNGSQVLFSFLNLFPDLKIIARYPIFAYAIIKKIIRYEIFEYFFLLEAAMKDMLVSIMNQQLSHYLTGDIKSHHLTIVNLNTIPSVRKKSLENLYKIAFETFSVPTRIVQEDITTFREGFAPDGLGLFHTSFVPHGNGWKKQLSFVHSVIQEFLASQHLKMIDTSANNYFKSILPFLQREPIPYYFILGCKKDILINEKEKDIIGYFQDKKEQSIPEFALVLNMLIDYGFLQTAQQYFPILFPKNKIEISDYPMNGWLLRGVSFFLNKFTDITALYLVNCSVTDQTLHILLDTINSNSKVEFISLENNALTDASVSLIRNAFQSSLSFLKKLDLSNNSISTSHVITLESDFPHIEFISQQSIPQEILNRGREFVEEYRRACNEGSQQIKFFRLMVVGSEGVGKTSLLKALRDQPFEEKETSTNFIEKTDITITELSNDWSQNLSFKERLKETRDDILAHITVKRVKSLTNLSNIQDTDLKDFIMQPSSPDKVDSDEIVFEPIVQADSLSKPDLGEEIKLESIETPTTPPILNGSQCDVDSSPNTPIEVCAPPSAVEIECEPVPTLPSISLEDVDTGVKVADIKNEPPVTSNLQLASLPLKNIQDHWSNQRALSPIEFFTVWDLAGQSYFFCMHSLFLTPRAVYILPVDLSVDLKGLVAQRERETGRLDRREIKGKVTHLDIIQYWIMTIYSVARSAASDVYECKSRIIIVFTKSDRVDNAVEKAANDFKLITDSLARKSNCLSIVDTKFHIVSAKDRSIDMFVQVKRAIHDNAEQIGFDHALPVRWLDFALCILSKQNPVIGKAEITKIASDTHCSQDYAEILQLFHSIGVFFFRKNILVKSLQNLLDIIFHIVSPMNCLNLINSTHKIAKSKHKQEHFKQDLDKAEKKAILTDDILNVILQHNSLTDVKYEIVQLLEEFGVMLFKHGHGRHQEHYIPYLFLEDISTIYQPESTDLVIFIYFPDYQVPTSFYFALLSLCLSQICNVKSSKSYRNEPKLAFDCVKFQWENKLTCIIDFTEHQPYIRIIFQDIEYSNVETSSKMFSVIFTLQKWIVHIQRELILAGKLAKIVLNCPCNSFSHTLRPCVYFETFLKQSALETHFYCKVKQTYFPWRFFNKLLPFKYVPPELGLTFLEKFHNHVVQKLDLEPILENLFEEGLVNGEELAQIYQLEDKEKVDVLLQNFPNKGKEWAHKFYRVLKSRNENHEIRSLFESFIIESLYSEIPKGEDLDFGRYPILNNPCGICLIIHIENFDDNSKRRGSHIDFLNLKETFENMNFLIYAYEDLTKLEIRKLLNNIRSMDHSAFDTFFCIIMSHGDEEDGIYTRDMLTIKKETIMNPFTADECPSLAGKPKVFIIQACRGQRQDQGFELAAKTDLSEGPDKPEPVQTDDLPSLPNVKPNEFNLSSPQEGQKKVANYADFYIAQATVKGYVSYRYTTKGSLFISAFCSVLKSARYHHHLVDIMIEVRRRVSMVDVNNNIQCPEATDTFTKQLYLF